MPIANVSGHEFRVTRTACLGYAFDADRQGHRPRRVCLAAVESVAVEHPDLRHCQADAGCGAHRDMGSVGKDNRCLESSQFFACVCDSRTTLWHSSKVRHDAKGSVKAAIAI
jgi:hypothetical protein